MTDQLSRAGRRGFLGAAVLGATLAGAHGALAQAGGGTPPTASTAADPVITRRIGRTSQTVTALGLGTFLTYDLNPGGLAPSSRTVLRG